MALHVSQPGRRRSATRGLNDDEQDTDTAALIRDLSIQSGTPIEGQFARQADVAVKLRQDLVSQPSSKDTFRRGGGFEKVLEVLRDINLRLTSPQDGNLAHDAATGLMQNLLRLLTEALAQHSGNERYFANHVDGWQSVHDSLSTTQRLFSAVNNCVGIARLYDSLLGFALHDHGIGSLAARISAGSDAEDVLDYTLPPFASLENAQACSMVLELAIESDKDEYDNNGEFLHRCIRALFRFVVGVCEASTRSAVALWQTGILSTLIRAYSVSYLSEHIRSLVLCIGCFGFANLHDVQFLFRSASSSEATRDDLLSLLRSSKQPAFVQFDMSRIGFAAIEIPSLRWAFPPAQGLALTAWIRIDEFDPRTHTTIFGAFDSTHSCFVLLYLEKDSRQLILQTSIRAPNPSVRFKSTQFEPGRWYHIALVQRKSSSDPSQSVASLYVDGNFAEQRRLPYPEISEEPSKSDPTGPRRHRPVQAFFGTTRGVAVEPKPNVVKSKWSLGNAHLYAVPLTDEFVAVHHRLGPHYSGNLQDCLGPLLTYSASSELNRYNEILHPEKTDKSDIVTATEGRGSDVVPESRLYLGISPHAVLDFDSAARGQNGRFELDQKVLPRYQKLMQSARAVAINTAVASIQDAFSRSFGTGILIGEPVVVVPRGIDNATWCLSGSLPVLTQLLESATTKKAFLQAAEMFCEAIKDSWRISEAMEKGHGFGVLAMIIREKMGFELGSAQPNRRPSSMLSLEERQSLPYALLELILDFVGYRKDAPEYSMLVNPMAYRVLLIDFDTWRRCDAQTQQLYYQQFIHFTTNNHNSSFNQKRLVRMRCVKKLIEALKSEDVTADASQLMMQSLKALIDGQSSQSIWRELAMYVAWGLHDERALPIAPARSFAGTVSLRQKVESWTRSARNSGPSTPGEPPQHIPKPGLSRAELAVVVLKLLADVIGDDKSATAIRRFVKSVTSRWLLHLLSENNVCVVDLTLSIICRAVSTLGSDFKAPFVDKHGGFVTLKARLKPFWRSSSVWSLAFAILFGCSVPLDWLDQDFTAFHLVEMLGVDDTLQISNPEMLSVIFTMLEAGLRRVASDAPASEAESKILNNVIQFFSELYDRSSAFREFAVSSRYLQELLFVLFPLLAGTDRLSAETELQSEALSFKGEEVRMRPHSNSLCERPPSVRSLNIHDTHSDNRTPSPRAANRVPKPRRISSFVLINDRLAVPPTQFKAPMAPPNGAPVRINVANALVEGLLELAITLIIDQVCHKDKFSGIGLFLRVPPGFKEYQAYFESYVLVHALSQLGSHLRLNQHLLLETRVLTNLARYSQHMAEAVSEGWFIDGAQPLLDFTGEILEHLQRPEIAEVKAVRLCSQSTTAIRVIFLKATLWRLAELNEDASEKYVSEFLGKMTYWQTILFSSENQESMFTKLICYLLYHKLVSSVQSVRIAAAQLWRMVLVQKPTETATILTNTMGPDQRHLSTGFMKLVSMDDEDFLGWVDIQRDMLDQVFYSSLSKPWDDFVETENRNSEETTKNRLNKRRDKLKQWQTEESAADDFINRYEVSTNHWRANVHAQERAKLQRAQQDHQENVNQLMTAFSRVTKWLRQPCGLDPAPISRWQLDETEAVNRMRMRLVPEAAEHKQALEPKRKGSQRAPNGKLSIDTRLRSHSEPLASPAPLTPGSPFPSITDGTSEPVELIADNGPARPRGDSISESQMLEGGFEMVDDPKEDEDGLIEDKNRKVMTSLQRGDMVQQLYNVSRIVGLEACEGLVVIGQKCFYMQDNFFQRSDGEIVSVSQAPEDERDPYVQLISGKDVGAQRTKHAIGDQETRHWTWDEVLSVSKRRFLLRDVSIEVFFSDGGSYLITCMTNKVRDDLYSAVVHRAPHIYNTSSLVSEDSWRLDTLRNPEEAPKNLGSKFNSLFNSGPTHAATKKWQRGEMSNFQYLMLINTMAGRTFNDLTQYPVFPWVLADYTSEELDLDHPKTFRDFSKPMGCQTPMREAEYKDRFKQFAEMGDQNAPSFHYGTHYSSAMIVSSYLIRLQPFVQSYLLLQGGSFDHADRLFDSIEKAWQSASKDTMSDVRELTPEFFYLPEFLSNVNKYDFGAKQVTGELVNDVKLPKWARGDPHIFITKHREALESPYVSQHLAHWIDLIFGYKQRGEAAIEATNVFNHLSYAGAKDLDKIDDRVEHIATIGIIHSFGQTPHQVFQKPHVYHEADKQTEPKLDTLAETLVRLPDPDVTTGEKVADFTLAPSQGRVLAAGPCKLNVLPDCTRYMQWGFADNSIRFFSSHSKRAIGLYENTHVGPVTIATFVDSKTLITGGQDCTIGVWKLTQSKDLIDITPKTYLFGHRTPVTLLAASRVFSTLLSVSADGQALLWGLNKFSCIRVLLPAAGQAIQAAKVSNTSGHILLCRGANVSLYTLNGHLLVEQKLCEREGEEILCCAFYEGQGNEYLKRELIFTGHAHGVTNVWAVTTLSDGSWYLQLVKRMQHTDFMETSGRVAGITAVLPSAREVYTGDEDGNIWRWECVMRGGSVSSRR